MRTLVIRMTMPDPSDRAELLFAKALEPSLRPFGDARLVAVEPATAEEEAELTRIGRRAGTPPRLAPELKGNARERRRQYREDLRRDS